MDIKLIKYDISKENLNKQSLKCHKWLFSVDDNLKTAKLFELKDSQYIF